MVIDLLGTLPRKQNIRESECSQFGRMRTSKQSCRHTEKVGPKDNNSSCTLPMKYFIETYGCQMNKYDSELVAGILEGAGYCPSLRPEDADVILVNTCSVRQHAEQRVLQRLNSFKALKLERPDLKIGVLGCMAQRLGEEILVEKPFIDFVIGPDSYRNILQVLNGVHSEQRESSPKIFLNEYESKETYADVCPVRVRGVNAWVAVMRGCNNYCTYCIVPYVRGRERSRSAQNVIEEIRRLVDEGFVEVTLLGQNVNSYWDGEHDFADLLAMVAKVEGIERVRFATSHPKDLSEKLVRVIAENEKICNHIHLPVQSGSTRILQLMNRHYSREDFLAKVEMIRKYLNPVGLTTDIIVGFPGEEEDDFRQTVELVREVEFDSAFVFKYSPRPGTRAAQFDDVVSAAEKTRRLEEINTLQKEITKSKNRQLIGQRGVILVEGRSKKSETDVMGRLETNKIVVIPNTILPKGKLVEVTIVGADGVTLFGRVNHQN
ncbi:tRNA (N6-isopentenyl adenosine(37)-C2)-methylthiotransferase MiaB [candidate division KSB1 bacterium]|nr:MAG: tRNA (N6-isopentenyl adenosine(37)-C2)-methylthiotransferase MiaB [candidate division KSB1 bacterium]